MNHFVERPGARAAAVLVALLVSLGVLTAPPVGPGGVARAETAGQSQFVPLAPTHLLDTRTGAGTTGTAKVPADESVTFQVADRGGVPATGVSAVALNIIAIDATGPGWFTLYPSDRPTTVSTLTFTAGENIAGEDFTPLTSTGKLTVKNNSRSTTHISIGVRGYFLQADDTQAGNEYYPLPSSLMYDTRSGPVWAKVPPAAKAQIPANGEATVDVAGQNGIPATGVNAVALNLVGVNQPQRGWLSVAPSDKPDPKISSVDYVPGEQDSSFEVAQLTATGKLTIRNHGAGPVDLSISVRGYFQGTADGGAGYKPVPTKVIVDTLYGTGVEDGKTEPIAAGASLTFDVAGDSGVPARQVGAVALNINARRPTSPGWLSAYPAGQGDPQISSVSFGGAGEGTNGFDQVIPDDDGKVTITNHSSGTTHVQVSVRGYYVLSDIDLGGVVDEDDPCLKEAGRAVVGAFTCVGSMLYYQKSAASGQATVSNDTDGWVSKDVSVPGAPEVPVEESDGIAGDPTDDPVPLDAPIEVRPEETVGLGEPNWDTFCEPKGVCLGPNRTATKAGIKANLEYGWIDGHGRHLWGRLDVIWEQNFNGHWSTYRWGVIWDKGGQHPEAYVDSLRAFVLEGIPGEKDPTHARIAITPNQIVNEGLWRFWRPSRWKYSIVDKPVPYRDGRRKSFHDDLDGSFWSNGRKFYMGKYHLPAFKTVRGAQNTYWSKYW